MTRIVLALVMVAALGGEAIAEIGQAAPRLKELAAVTSEVVRIGDLVENAGASADVPVFRAPDLGQTGAVQVSRIAEALRPYDMDALDTGGLTEVVGTRLSRALTTHDNHHPTPHARHVPRRPRFRRPVQFRRRAEYLSRSRPRNPYPAR